MDVTTLIILAVLLLVGMPWIFIAILVSTHRRHERAQRESLVYMRSASAFEAEDMIDRVRARDPGIIAKGLAKMKSKDDTLTEDPAADMARDIRDEITKAYSKES